MNTKLLLSLLVLSLLPFADLRADLEKDLNDLIPKLADSNVPDRYNAQMALQDLASNASRPGAEAERAAFGQMLAVKAADAALPQPARIWIVRQLEYMGRAEAVDALTQLLNGGDAELRECARRALEKNPDASASVSLRTALANSQETAWTIGLMNSLGQRGDGEAVGLIAKHLEEASMAQPAALALGRIGNRAAVEALFKALDQQTAGAADGLIIAANRFAARERVAPARRIYLRLYQPENPLPVRAAALVGLAKVDVEGARPLVTEALASGESRLQNAALDVARGVLGPELSPTLVSLLPRLSPPAKAKVLGALDASAETSVIAAASDPEEVVRLAALDALGRMGGRASVPVLLQASSTGEAKSVIMAADVALARIADPEAVREIAKAAAEGEPRLRIAAIGALAARKYQPALPALIKYADDSESAVSKAALAALGQMAGDNEIESLARISLRSQKAEAASALEAAAGRAKNKPLAANRLLALAGSDEQSLAVVAEALSVLGGHEAMTALTKLTRSSSTEVQDNAIRALSHWPDYEALQSLQAIAGNPTVKPNHKILAQQGIVRLLQSAENEPIADRLEAALSILNAAQRDEEKKLALSALSTVASPKAAEIIEESLKDPKLKTDAGVAALALAARMAATDKPAARKLAQAVREADINRDLTRRANALLR